MKSHGNRSCCFISCYKLIEGFPLTSIVGDGAGVGKGRTVAGEASVC